METAYSASSLRDYSDSPSFSSLFGFDLGHIPNSLRNDIMREKGAGRKGERLNRKFNVSMRYQQLNFPYL